MSFQIFNATEIESFRKGGKILRGCLDMLPQHVRPGVTTKQLDPAFKGYHGFTGTLCTSINEECVHGIPGNRELIDGDIISLDCGVIYDGLYTDACTTVGVGQISKEAQHLLHVTENALADAVAFLKAGVRVGDLSSLIQQSVEKGGCRAVRSLTGHGLGKTLHQFPDIPNIGKAGTGPVFPANTVVAVEPIVALSADDVYTTDDGWTLITEDGSLSAHFEHTLLLLPDGCEVIA
jgi:methionyl aminopeptidase